MFKSNIEGRLAPRGKEPNLPGDRYGRLTLVEEVAGQTCRLSVRKWLCRCECGVETQAHLNNLRGGRTTSCGCYQREAAASTTLGRATTHGLSQHPLYHTHNSMLRRCYNPEHKHFASYGGRGITVCERWLSVENFLEDMYPTYSPGLSLEREDNALGYSPENCVWATDLQQGRNQRRNRLVSYLGKNICLAEAAEIAGLNYRRVHNRLSQLGWPTQKALESENFSDPLPK